MTERKGSYALFAVLVTISAFAAFSLVAAMLGPGFQGFLDILTAPGAFLYRSFHVAALFVPAFLGAHAVLAVRRPFAARAFHLTNFAVVPFLTGSVTLRLLVGPAGGDAPATRWLIEIFSRSGAALLLALTTALALLFIIQQLQRGKPGAHGAAPSNADDDDTISGRTRRVAALLTSSSSGIDAHGHTAAGTADADVEPTSAPSGDAAPATEPLPTLEAVDDEDELGDDSEIILGEWEAVEPVGAAAELRKHGGNGRNGRSAGAGVDSSHTGVEDASDDAPGDDYDYYEDEDDEYLAFSGEELAGAPRGLAVGADYDLPIDGVLRRYEEYGYWQIDEDTRHAAEVLRVTLEEFNIQAEVTGIRKGPVITMFEILPAPGVKLAKITNLADNIALRLAASSVRIVAPIPGKHAVGIEIPNKQRHIVSFAELIQDDDFFDPKREIPLAIGKDIPGDAQIVDLTKTPHLLIAGATGSGKSVCVNSIICSVLYRRSPAEVRLMLIDPKIVELKFYNDIPHLLTPVITDPKRAFQALQYCIYEMERRYSLLDAVGVRDVRAYNEKIHRRNLAMEHLPYIVVIVDEFADLMATSGKELESTVARLAAMSRAVGIHLVLATQRPSTDVITGLIKANIPSRVAFMVSSKVDSRIIIDAVGAEKLLGQGDMLLTSAWDPFPKRIQGAFLADEEVERVVEYVKQYGEPDYIDDEIFIDEEDGDDFQQELEDPLLEKAIDIVVSANKASASYLQRRLKVGYNRAARMVEEMERLGIVGPQQGSKPRDIIGRPE
ncbi:MAG: DNA translocase FtsK [bacterium]